MTDPICRADLQPRYEVHGFIRAYRDRITEQWLFPAPQANPAMMEMFRERDVPPLRDPVGWAGVIAGNNA